MSSIQNQKSLDNTPSVVFNQLAEFYNVNSKTFQLIEKQTGLNFWFLLQLRTYYTVLASVQKDKPYKRSIEDSKLLKVWKELQFIIRQKRCNSSIKDDVLILSKPTDRINNVDKRFAELQQCYQVMVSRDLMNFELDLPIADDSFHANPNSDQVFKQYLFSFSWIKDVLVFLKHWRKMKSLRINHSQLDSLIFKSVQGQKFSVLFYYLKFKSFDSYFKRMNLKSIVMSDENSPQHKVIQYAAKKNCINVFAFQHGNIHSLHPAYIFGNYENKPLLPDVTFTWGKFFTRILMKEGGYESNQVRTIGRINDVTAKRYLNPEIADLKLPILLYASQPEKSEIMRRQKVLDVLTAAKAVQDRFTLVIRPHPREYTNEYFDEIAQEVGFFNYIVDRSSDLVSHFERCAVLITSFSTVGVEFIPYFKPLLVLDYLKQDLIGYIKSNVGVAIYNLNDLKHALIGGKNNLLVNESANKAFVDDYFYKVDGKAAERVKSIIDSY